MTSVTVYNRYLNTRGGGEKMALALALALASLPDWDVTVLTDEVVDRDALSTYFNMDLEDLRIHRAKAGRFTSRLLATRRVPGLVKNLVRERSLQRAALRLDGDIFVNNTQWSFLPNPAPTGVYSCMFPTTQEPLTSPSRIRATYLLAINRVTRLVLYRRHRRPIDSYEHILANSEFTRRHIHREWGRQSSLLFPPCENMSTGGVEREKLILSVGRFFPEFGDVHHKRQDVLLDQFLAMPDLAEQGWRLAFVGSASRDEQSMAFLASLRERARDAPVTFHTDLDFNALREMYNRATVYWHATGFGSDEEAQPERQEHFGIVTAEAMSAGCIPIVLDRGGQREIVADGVDGFRWKTTEELRELTRKVANASESERDSIRTAAVAAARRFGMPEFRRTAIELFEQLRISG